MTNSDRPLAHADVPPTAGRREGMDAEMRAALKRDPSDCDAKLDVALHDSFPTSDPPSQTQPGKGKDPLPSSGFKDDDAEPPTLDGE